MKKYSFLFVLFSLAVFMFSMTFAVQADTGLDIAVVQLDEVIEADPAISFIEDALFAIEEPVEEIKEEEGYDLVMTDDILIAFSEEKVDDITDEVVENLPEDTEDDYEDEFEDDYFDDEFDDDAF